MFFLMESIQRIASRYYSRTIVTIWANKKSKLSIVDGKVCLCWPDYINFVSEILWKNTPCMFNARTLTILLDCAFIVLSLLVKILNIPFYDVERQIYNK